MEPDQYYAEKLIKPHNISLEGFLEEDTYSEEGLFSGIKSIFNIITVEEKDNIIRVDGIHGHNYANAIRKIWATSKIADNIFNKKASGFVEFNAFFAVEIAYTLQQLINSNKLPYELRDKKDLLRKILNDLYEFTWLKETRITHSNSILNHNALNQFAYKPLDHQLGFFKIIEDIVPRYKLNGYLLDAKPGAGKTLTALMLSSMLEADTFITCCPKKAIHDPWVKTLSVPGQGFVNPPGCWDSASGKPLDFTAKYFVIHYEAMKDVLPLLLAHRDKLGKRLFINLDECHNMNDSNSQRSELFTSFVKAIDPVFTLFMSGTPIKAMGTETIPLLRCIDKMFTTDTEERFRKIWGKNQSKALDILANRIGLVSYVVPKEAFREGNPPIVNQVKVKLPANEAAKFTLDNLRIEMQNYAQERMDLYSKNMAIYRREYDYCLSLHEKTLESKEDLLAFETYKQYVAVISKSYDPVLHKKEAMYCNQYEDKNIIPSLPPTLKKDFRNYKSIIKYVHLKVLGECLGTILGKRRTECNTALVKHCGLPDLVRNAIKKTLVFSSWVETIKEADQLLRDEGFITTMVYGDTNKNLKTIIEDFGKKPEINPLLATYQSLSEAVPLTMANNVVMLNLPFRDKDYSQTIARTDRIGQDTQVYVWEVLLDTGLEPNISTRAKDIMEWSQAQVMAIMGYDNTPANTQMAKELSTGFMDQTITFDTLFQNISDNGVLNTIKKIFT